MLSPTLMLGIFPRAKEFAGEPTSAGIGRGFVRLFLAGSIGFACVLDFGRGFVRLVG